jgi:hypothetical protein
VIPIKKPRPFFLILALSIFFLQNCATIINGSFQKIPITSNPPGAKIIVDGKVKGNTPLNLNLKKMKNHVFRIEKDGYNPLEIKIQRESTSKSGFTIAGDVIAGGVIGYLIFSVAYSKNDPHRNLFLPLFFWGCSLVGVIAVDYIGGGLYELSPTDLHVTLTKIEDQARIDLIILDARQLNNIRWIRIKCLDDKEEERMD